MVDFYSEINKKKTTIFFSKCYVGKGSIVVALWKVLKTPISVHTRRMPRREPANTPTLVMLTIPGLTWASLC